MGSECRTFSRLECLFFLARRARHRIPEYDTGRILGPLYNLWNSIEDRFQVLLFHIHQSIRIDSQHYGTRVCEGGFRVNQYGNPVS